MTRVSKKNPFDFPGSQAAQWRLGGEIAIVDVCGAVSHTSPWRVVRETDERCITNMAHKDELEAIGPVARELLGRK